MRRRPTSAWPASDAASQAALAKALGRLAVGYGLVGRHGQAVDCGHRAIELLERLSGVEVEVGESLASAYGNLAIAYGKAGDLGSAIAWVERGIVTWKQLAELEANPVALIQLAQALKSLASFHRAAGRRGEAVVPAERAVAIYQRLAEGQPQLSPLYADSLGELGGRYSEAGQGAAAVAAAEAAVEIFEELAVENRGHRPGLARALIGWRSTTTTRGTARPPWSPPHGPWTCTNGSSSKFQRSSASWAMQRTCSRSTSVRWGATSRR